MTRPKPKPKKPRKPVVVRAWCRVNERGNMILFLDTGRYAIFKTKQLASIVGCVHRCRVIVE